MTVGRTELRGGVGRGARRPVRHRRGRSTLPSGLVGAVAAVLLSAAGCVDAEAGSMPEVAPFPGAAESLEGLADQALLGLSTGDAAVLAEVRLTAHEHNEVLWPELPASDPALNVPVDYAWNDIQVRDRAALDRIAEWYRGREVELRTAECEGAPQEFATFVVMTDCWVVFDVAEGEPSGRFRAQLFKDVVVRGGGYKIFRYYDELPEPFGA